jgi:hypothetical protein
MGRGRTGTVKEKWIDVEWYCRACWKRSIISINIWNMTIDEVRNEVRSLVICCNHKDIRVHLDNKTP